MAVINMVNDFLKSVLEQNIKQSREQIEQYFDNQMASIQNNYYLSDYEKKCRLNSLELERERLLNIQDRRELAKKIAEFCNEVSKSCEKEENKK